MVSCFVFLRYADVSRFDFEFSMSMVPCNESRQTVWMSDEWLHDVGMSQVSRFVPLRYFVIHMLDLGLHRFDLDAATLMVGSTDVPVTF